MAKITGMEAPQELPAKVLQIYEAVEKLILAGEDLNLLRVSAIAELAGIGKGTVYDYFDTKEELIACALIYQIRKLSEELREIFSRGETVPVQIALCMEEMERDAKKRQGFLRYVHVMTQNAVYCQIVREKMQQKELAHHLPAEVFRDMIGQGVARGEVRKDISVDCVLVSVFSKLFTYLISRIIEDYIETGASEMREYVYQSLMAEICEGTDFPALGK